MVRSRVKEVRGHVCRSVASFQLLPPRNRAKVFKCVFNIALWIDYLRQKHGGILRAS